jgi:hypothetical protein
MSECQNKIASLNKVSNVLKKINKVEK